jgi:hypothetical protein
MMKILTQKMLGAQGLAVPGTELVIPTSEARGDLLPAASDWADFSLRSK